MSDESLSYFKHHVDKYPTWGLVLCLEKGQEPATIYWSPEYGPDKVKETSIHKIQCRYGDAPDDYVIHEVLKEFPEYDDDSDPLVEEPKEKSKWREPAEPSTDAIDAMSMATKAMRDMGSAMGRFGGGRGRPPREIDPEKHKEMFGVYPGEPIRPDTSMPVKVMQFTYTMDIRELERYGPMDRLRGLHPEDIPKRLSPELLRRIKHEMIEQLINCDSFWDVELMDTVDMSPFGRMNFVVRMGIAPMGDVAKSRREERIRPRYDSPYFGSGSVSPLTKIPGDFSVGIDTGMFDFPDPSRKLSIEDFHKAMFGEESEEKPDKE